MRKLCMALATVCALGTTTTPLLAAERAEFQLSPRAGRGVLKLDRFRNLDDDLAELDTGGIGVSFGVLTPIGLLVEGGTETYGNFDFFNADDEFSLRQHYAAIGYQFELGDGWHIVPTRGRAATILGFGKRVSSLALPIFLLRSLTRRGLGSPLLTFFAVTPLLTLTGSCFVCADVSRPRPLATNTTCSAMFLA